MHTAGLALFDLSYLQGFGPSNCLGKPFIFKELCFATKTWDIRRWVLKALLSYRVIKHDCKL